MELKGWISESDESMHRVEFSIDKEGMVSARRDGEIFDHSDDLSDFVQFCNDAVYTERTATYGRISYKAAVKLSEWFRANGAKGAYY